MTDTRKYYEAYDDRYKQVHDANLQWFSDTHSQIVSEAIEEFGILKTASILEIGCGEDREAFYRFIYEHLNASGIALICTMGDGEFERQSDIKTAFELQERMHERSGKTLKIAGTSCRMVGFETFRNELHKNGFEILKEGVTSIEPEFSHIMYAVVRRERL